MPSCHPARSTGSQGRGVHVSHGTLHTHFLIRVPVHAMGQRVTLCEVHRKIMATKNMFFGGQGQKGNRGSSFPKTSNGFKEQQYFKRGELVGSDEALQRQRPKCIFRTLGSARHVYGWCLPFRVSVHHPHLILTLAGLLLRCPQRGPHAPPHTHTHTEAAQPVGSCCLSSLCR
jgi:hypothetical protein